MLTLPNPYHMFSCAISVVSRDYPCHRLVAGRQQAPAVVPPVCRHGEIDNFVSTTFKHEIDFQKFITNHQHSATQLFKLKLPATPLTLRMHCLIYH